MSILVAQRGRVTNRVINTLRWLGIPYKKRYPRIRCRYGYSFWRENEGELEYILYDALKKIKQLKAQLHPDRENGNLEEFINLNEKAIWLEAIFRRHGVGSTDPAGEIKKKEEKEIQRQARYKLAHPNPGPPRGHYKKKAQKAHNLLWFLQQHNGL